MDSSPDIIYICEYLKDVLYFAVVRQGKVITSNAKAHCFSVDNVLVYNNYYADFGPLNLSCVYKYCATVNYRIKTYYGKLKIVHFTSDDPRKQANAAFLIGCYGVLYLNYTPKQAYRSLMINGYHYRQFQDAVQGESLYTISIFDCLCGIQRARDLGFFNFLDFNVTEYDGMDSLQGGDLHWIIPEKFLAFIGPVDNMMTVSHRPQHYIDYFIDNKVNLVIRLNKKFYDEKMFLKAGIRHQDLYFLDGSCPPTHILLKFLQMSEDPKNLAIAVHCKAGLGRTGTLIGCYLMKHYQFSAKEAIAWMRICRPGSVIGAQQAWLEKFESWLHKQGNSFRKRNHGDADEIKRHTIGIYSFGGQNRNIQHYNAMSTFKSKAEKISKRVEADDEYKVGENAEKSTQFRPLQRPRSANRRPRAPKTRALVDQSTDLADVVRSLPKEVPETTRKVNQKQSAYTEPIEVQIHPHCEAKQLHERLHSPSGNEANRRIENALNYPRSDKLNVASAHIQTDFENDKSSQVGNEQKSDLVLLADAYQQSLRDYCEKHWVEAPRVHCSGAPCPHSPPIQRRSKFVQDNMPAYISSSSVTIVPKIVKAYPAESNGNVNNPPVAGPRNSKVSSKRMSNKNADSKLTIRNQKPQSKQSSRTPERSIGAGSLGAPRNAPLPPKPSSARSDNPRYLTQGDMLNSVKFERQFANNRKTIRVSAPTPQLRPRNPEVSNQIQPTSNTKFRRSVRPGMNTREKQTSLEHNTTLVDLPPNPDRRRRTLRSPERMSFRN